MLVRRGQFLSELTPAQLTGATLGTCFCKMRRIYAGFSTKPPCHLADRRSQSKITIPHSRVVSPKNSNS
jgi:hypothetical protein